MSITGQNLERLKALNERLPTEGERADADLALQQLEERIAQSNIEKRAPIPMRLPCERCGHLHIDVGEFATKPHHTHVCQHCGLTWRPAKEHTVGVQWLPGFKNTEAPARELHPGEGPMFWGKRPDDWARVEGLGSQAHEPFRPPSILPTWKPGDWARFLEKNARDPSNIFRVKEIAYDGYGQAYVIPEGEPSRIPVSSLTPWLPQHHEHVVRVSDRSIWRVCSQASAASWVVDDSPSHTVHSVPGWRTRTTFTLSEIEPHLDLPHHPIAEGSTWQHEHGGLAIVDALVKIGKLTIICFHSLNGTRFEWAEERFRKELSWVKGPS